VITPSLTVGLLPRITPKTIGLLIAQEAALYHENKMRISDLRSQIQN